MFNMKERLRAAGIHFSVTGVVAGLSALLVFGVWYPYPYSEISGGRELFLLVVTVDVILGPLITLAIFDRRKPWLTLRKDLAVVALLQLAALAYGLSTVFVARPVHLVFEYDRFRVVHALDVPADMMDKAPPELRGLPWGRPTMVALRGFKNPKENFTATMAALQGVSLASRPDLWRPYADARADVLKVAKPVPQLLSRFKARQAEIDAAVRTTGRPVDQLVWVPMVGRKTFWTALLDSQSAQVLGFLPLDSF